MSSKRRRPAAVWVAVGGVLTALCVPLLATPAHAVHTDSGTITAPAPIGNHSTDIEFVLTCPDPPSTQGVNGWVFELPASVTPGMIVGLTGSDAQDLYDLSAYVYNDDCTFDRVATGATQDLYVTVDGDDTFLSVFTTNGADVTVNLAAPATPPTPFPNDPLFWQSGEKDPILAGQWNMRKVRAPEAWAEATGAGITVAVLDTGLDLGHPDFNCANKIDVVPGADPDPDGSNSPQDEDGHGTHVAGIVGACTDNGIGVAGIAPDSTIMPIQVLSDTSTVETIAEAIETATDEGAHVINMSLSVGPGVAGFGVPGGSAALGFFLFFPEIDEAIEYAISQGVVVVASAGNESFPLCSFPAISYNVICVGSTDPNDANAWYGSFPAKDDDDTTLGPGMVAPGGMGNILFCDVSATEIISTYDEDVDDAEDDCDGNFGYTSMQGTSMAAPLVSGAAALVYEDLGGVRNTTNAAKVTQALLESADDLYTPGWDPMSGEGRLDALGAVQRWP